MLLHQAYASFAVGYKVDLNNNIILSISNINVFIPNKLNTKKKRN